MATSPEGKLKARCLSYLRSLSGVWVYPPSDRFRAGIPDLLICYKGSFIGIELKTKRGRLSPIQKHTLESIRGSGGTAMVCRSLNEVKALIESFG